MSDQSNVIKCFTNEDLQAKIDNEGFDYFFSAYISPDAVKDPELRAYVEQYVKAREAIAERLTTLGIEVLL